MLTVFPSSLKSSQAGPVLSGNLWANNVTFHAGDAPPRIGIQYPRQCCIVLLVNCGARGAKQAGCRQRQLADWLWIGSRLVAVLLPRRLFLLLFRIRKFVLFGLNRTRDLIRKKFI